MLLRSSDADDIIAIVIIYLYVIWSSLQNWSYIVSAISRLILSVSGSQSQYCFNSFNGNNFRLEGFIRKAYHKINSEVGQLTFIMRSGLILQSAFLLSRTATSPLKYHRCTLKPLPPSPFIIISLHGLPPGCQNPADIYTTSCITHLNPY